MVQDEHYIRDSGRSIGGVQSGSLDRSGKPRDLKSDCDSGSSFLLDLAFLSPLREVFDEQVLFPFAALARKLLGTR